MTNGNLTKIQLVSKSFETGQVLYGQYIIDKIQLQLEVRLTIEVVTVIQNIKVEITSFLSIIINGDGSLNSSKNGKKKKKNSYCCNICPVLFKL